MNRLGPTGIALGVSAGLVFGEAVDSVLPANHLVRPLLACVALSVILGLASLAAGRYAVPIAGAAALLVVSPGQVAVLIVLSAATVIVASRVLDREVDLSKPLLAASAVFAIAGGVQFVPMLALGTPALADVAVDGPPVYLMLLDGYPRVDVLDELGFDNDPFIAEMEAHGFKHHPDARSLHRTTYRTLTAMLVGRVDPDTWGTVEERRAARQEWRLPPAFVAISSPYSHTNLPHSVDIGPGRISTFDIHLLESSILGSVAGDLILDQFRFHVEESIRMVATTDHHRVFAHIPAPHPPYLVGPDGEPAATPECWPDSCDLWDDRPSSDRDLYGTVEWLNGLLVDMIEGILEERPDAVIVLFGDHGIRLTDGPPEQAYLPLLLSRGLEIDESRPDRIFDALNYRDGGS